MAWTSRPITDSIVGGELVALQEAVSAIWDAHMVALLNGGTSAQFKRHVEPQIYAAAKLLPPEMRKHGFASEDTRTSDDCKPRFPARPMPPMDTGALSKRVIENFPTVLTRLAKDESDFEDLF